MGSRPRRYRLTRGSSSASSEPKEPSPETVRRASQLEIRVRDEGVGVRVWGLTKADASTNVKVSLKSLIAVKVFLKMNYIYTSIYTYIAKESQDSLCLERRRRWSRLIS